MAQSDLASPVVVDGVVSVEKVAELVALGGEFAELDYKEALDLSATRDVVEIAKDIGAMQVGGGYVLLGVDSNGIPTGRMDDRDLRAFDEANLVPKLRKYLPSPLQLSAASVTFAGHTLIAICVPANSRGCAFFVADGKYLVDGREKVAFRRGDVYFRDGTRSERMTQEGLEAVIERRVSNAKLAWIIEQQEVRRHERAEIQAGYEARGTATGPLGSLSIALPLEELTTASLELVRRGDTVGLLHLIHETTARARSIITEGDVEEDLGELLDTLVSLAATFLTYEQTQWFERVVGVLNTIYAMPADADAVRSRGYASSISTKDAPTRVWLAIVGRVYALGGLAVRRRDWDAVRTLVLQLPEPLASLGYDTNWLRHTLTMASRAQQFDAHGQKTSLLTIARKHAARLPALRSDGYDAEDDVLLTSIAEFDLLFCVVAIGDADSTDGKVYYPNFARLQADRVQLITERLLTDEPMRAALFGRGDGSLAIALSQIGETAAREGLPYAGFAGWHQTAVQKFLDAHL